MVYNFFNRIYNKDLNSKCSPSNYCYLLFVILIVQIIAVCIDMNKSTLVILNNFQDIIYTLM